jgi:hypothetical protein
VLTEEAITGERGKEAPEFNTNAIQHLNCNEVAKTQKSSPGKLHFIAKLRSLRAQRRSEGYVAVLIG